MLEVVAETAAETIESAELTETTEGKVGDLSGESPLSIEEADAILEEMMKESLESVDVMDLDIDDSSDLKVNPDKILEDWIKESSEEQSANETGESETEDTDVDEQQRAAIEEGLRRLRNGELTSAEKGNLCEMMMDQYYISKGYKPIHNPRITSLDDSGHQGIDGVYEKTNEDGSKEYIIADAKYDQATLSTTVDGTKQMSDKWIDQRLDASVGKEKADEIRMSDNVSKEVFHMKPDSENQSEGSCEVRGVDDNGEYNSPKENVGEYSPTDFNFDKESDDREG